MIENQYINLVCSNWTGVHITNMIDHLSLNHKNINLGLGLGFR